MTVPFVDLRRQAAAISDDLEDGFADVLRRGRFVGGPALERFEAEFAAYCGAEHAVGVNSGTDAIALALRAHGVGPGDEVVTAANTCVATITAIVATGATPVLADADPATWTLDPASAEATVTPRTKALVPVHLYGQCADLGPLRALATDRGLVLVEDAAQAHGALYRGFRPGSVSTAAYSFYPTKNLGALGDAGAVVTTDTAVAGELRRLRSHGERAEARGIALVPGVNSRLDEIQAELLARKLAHLDAWNERRRELAAFYRRELADGPVTLPVEAEGRVHAWHLFVVLAENRDGFRAELHGRGVETLVHYPEPIHLQPAYTSLAGDVSLAVSERLCERVVSLPLYPGLTDAEAEQVAEAVRAA
ncbi:MAG: DegT/DnrJ/EryC1/StrS family aminotransferase [Verrucomicrobiota bacterium]